MSKTIETPATEAVASTALFAVIDEDAFEQIQETARRLYLKSQRGYRGQQLTMQDSYDYWIMVATREFLSANPTGQPPPRLGGGKEQRVAGRPSDLSET